MPAARHLFARAIMMSGPFTLALTLDKARAVAERVLAAAGCSAAELGDAAVEVVLAAQDAALHALQPELTTGSISDALGLGPALDERHLPAHPFDPAAGLVTGKQLMLGYTDHEFGMFLVEDPDYTSQLTAEEAIGRLDQMAPGAGRSAFEALRAAHPDEPSHLLLARALSQRLFGDPTLALADSAAEQAESVWVYKFEQRTDVLDGVLGACHSLDLAYAFGTIDRIPLTGTSPARRATSAEVMRAWTSFAHDGRPVGTTALWGAWNATTRSSYRFVHRQ